jgi:hypothetical protein
MTTPPIEPLPLPPSNTLRNKIMLGIMAALAFVFALIVLVVFALPKIAPPPLEIKNNPSPVASNPRDADHWDFTNPDPVLHPGDPIIVEVIACVSDPFGGSVIHASGSRRLISESGLGSDQLDSTDTPVATRPCAASRANVGTISYSTPSGRYRVEANVHAATALYSRDSNWYTIWFTVANP